MRWLASLLLLHALPGVGQVSSVISLSNGVRFKVASETGKSTPDPLKLEMKPATGNSVYRILRDQSGLAVFAYELVIDRLPDGDHFQIIAKPAGNDFAAKFPNADGGKPTPTFPINIESPPLGAGGQFSIGIPTDPGLFEHRMDLVQVQPDVRSGNPAPMIRFVDLKVLINGAVVPTSGPGKDVSGTYAMFYIPKRGGYFFSTEPVTSRPFAQSATVERNHLKFSADNRDYDCVSAAPILTESVRGQIWMYYDPSYKPSGAWTKPNPKSPDAFFTAASDTLGWWLP